MKKERPKPLSFVTFGQGRGLVVAIGDATETGRISQLMEQHTNLSTPLTRKFDKFSRTLLYIILGVAALTFAVGWGYGNSWVTMFEAAVALAVSAIPKGLPAVVTITLAIGVSRMARRHAIVRKLPAVETLGGATVICSDKTGTLIDVIPFESEFQYIATLHESTEVEEIAPSKIQNPRSKIIYVKGSVEAVLLRCQQMLDDRGNLIPVDREAVHQEVDAMAHQGLRVLALAEKPVSSTQDSLDHADIEADLIFIGLQGMIDPPRSEAIKAVQACQEAGIQVKMITGDHAVTARAIASRMGLNRYR